MKRRQTFTLSDDLLNDIAEFRWRNRIPSLSKALELILRRAVESHGAAKAQEADPAQSEREMNNRAYKEVRATLRSRAEGTFVIIALGKLQGRATTLENAYSLLKERAPTARHAIIDKTDERVEAEATWEAVGERIH